MTKETFVMIQLANSTLVFLCGLYMGRSSLVKTVNRELMLRLRTRASIRRNIITRKSVQEGKPDRIADLLDEAADEIERLSK